MKPTTRSLSLAVLAASTLGPVLADAAVFTGLGDLPGGGPSSIAHGISADGSTVVGRSRSDINGPDSTGFEAFRWNRPQGIVGLGSLPNTSAADSSIAYGVSGDGSVTVGEAQSAAVGNFFEAFRHTDTGGMQGLGLLPSPNFPLSIAYGVSSDGQQVVGESGVAQAFRWTASEGLVPIDPLPGNREVFRAYAISGDGTTIVGEGAGVVTGPNSAEGFVFTADTGTVGVGDLAGGDDFSVARGVSADGTTVVGYSRSSHGGDVINEDEAFIWTMAGGIVGLGVLDTGATASQAFDVSADGQVIVGRSGTGRSEAVVWDGAGEIRAVREILEELGQGEELIGWSLTEVVGVSDDGRTLAGNGINPDGESEAWAAVIPEPSSLLISLALWSACAARRRRAKS